MSKQRNTHEKRLREQLKKRKSDDKRARRVARKDTLPLTPASSDTPPDISLSIAPSRQSAAET